MPTWLMGHKVHNPQQLAEKSDENPKPEQV
jgi:hypothetical protein